MHLREEICLPLAPTECREHDAVVAQVRRLLGEAWTAGQALTMEEAVVFALEESMIA